jgi:protein TonB
MFRKIVALILSSVIHLGIFAMLPASARRESEKEPIVMRVSLADAGQFAEEPEPEPEPIIGPEPEIIPPIIEPVSEPEPEPVKIPEPKPVKKEKPKKPEKPVVKKTAQEKPKPRDETPAAPMANPVPPAERKTPPSDAPAREKTPAEPASNIGRAPEKKIPAKPEIIDAAQLKAVKKVNPDYPMICRKRRDQGTVVLLIDISAGRVKSVKVERGSGYAPLDESAMRAAKQWAFDTSGFGNEITARIPFRFELK